MVVSTSKSGRSSGAAKRTPPVATSGTRNASARHDQRVVVVFLIAPEMPLQLDVDVAAAEEADESIEQPADAVALGQQQRSPGQRDEAGREPLEVLERQRALAFRARAASCASRGGRDCASPRGIRPGRARPIARVGDRVIGRLQWVIG